MRPVPMIIPTINAVNGNEPTPGFHPRSSWKEIGNWLRLELGC